MAKTVIGKNRRVDVLALRPTDQVALGIECKLQDSRGTTDEKIDYALRDLEAMWIPGVLVYTGDGWSPGVMHTLQGSKLAADCRPDKSLQRTRHPLELDYVLASVFGFWDLVLDPKRRFHRVQTSQLELPPAPTARVKSKPAKKRSRKKTASAEE
ncbi:MAG: PD-(D/E)XK nuclease superfamily protein [Nannocystales bacterium]